MSETAKEAIAASPFNWRNQTSQTKAAQDRLAAHRAAKPTDRAGLMAAVQRYFGLNDPQIQRVGLAHRNFTGVQIRTCYPTG